MALRNLQSNIEQCILLLNKTTQLPELIGLNADEVYRQLFNKDPHICSKCKKGKLNQIPVKSKSPS